MNEESVNNIMGYFTEIRNQKQTNINSGFGIIQTHNTNSGHLSFNQNIIDKRIAGHIANSAMSANRFTANQDIASKGVLGTMQTNELNTISLGDLPKGQNIYRPDLDDEDVQYDEGQN